MTEADRKHSARPPVGDHRQADYRPISLWAIASIIGGGASTITLLVGHPAIVVVPAIGIVVAVVALVKTGGPAAIVSGRWLAVVGLMAALTLGAVTISNHLARRHWAQQEAQQFTDHWVEALRLGRRRTVHEMSLTPHKRCPSNRTLSHCYRNTPGRRDAMDRYLDPKNRQTAAIRQMLRWGRSAQSQRISTRILSFSQSRRDVVGVEYRIRFEDPRFDKSSKTPRYLRVQVERTIDPSSGKAHWRIVRQTLASEMLD